MTAVVAPPPPPPTTTRPSLLFSMRKRFNHLRVDFQGEMGISNQVAADDDDSNKDSDADDSYYRSLWSFRRGGGRVSKRELSFRSQIRCFEEDLHSKSFVAKLNSTIQNRIVSGSDFVSYYKSRPDLKEYTLEEELYRMDYTLITPRDKALLTSPSDIREYVQNESPEEAEKHELLYRSANQSIFADVIIALTSFDGLVRPQLCAGTFVDKCSVIIDLSASPCGHVRAQCYLNISIPDCQGNRLSMASVLVSTVFQPSTEQLRAGILHLLPLPYLTNEEANGAAKSLAQ